MDLPRAEIRYHGVRAVVVAIVRRMYRIAGWIRPRAAPLAITLLATLCMLAGLDLIAHDIRSRRPPPESKPFVFYLMAMPKQDAPAPEVIPVELVSTPGAPLAPAIDLPE